MASGQLLFSKSRRIASFSLRGGNDRRVGSKQHSRFCDGNVVFGLLPGKLVLGPNWQLLRKNEQGSILSAFDLAGDRDRSAVPRPV